MATLLYNNLPTLRPTRAFSAVLNDMLRDTLPSQSAPTLSFIPQADIVESEHGFELHLMVPGVAKEHIKIDFQEGKLTVSGERPAPETTENGPKFRRVESGYGSFTRTFRLPETIDVTAIDAQLQDGVLRLTLPYDSKKVSKHQIEIR